MEQRVFVAYSLITQLMWLTIVAYMNYREIGGKYGEARDLYQQISTRNRD